MQRVRIGLTGLAFIFLLVMLAAIFSSPDEEEPITANSVEQGLTPGGPSAKKETPPEPKEPLAELGVAPGNVDTNASAATSNGQAANR
jgi:hypothetical protein